MAPKKKEEPKPVAAPKPPEPEPPKEPEFNPAEVQVNLITFPWTLREYWHFSGLFV